MIPLLPMISLLCATALAQMPLPAKLLPSEARGTVLDLWRPWVDADKVYVMVGLPDGSEELFMVDTGASVSVINDKVAARLGLQGQDTGGQIQGLSGAVPWLRATIPTVRIGDFTLEGVDVAVGVPGVPELAGVLPVGGILGTNVWGNFTCVMDYPADRMELHRPRAYRLPRKAAPMIYDGHRAVTEVGIRAVLDGQTREAVVLLQVDTGAHDLLFSGRTGEPFREVSTVGVEPVLGVGADLDSLPETELLRLTRRVHVEEVQIDGRWIDLGDQPMHAQWVGADSEPVGPANMIGLLGYEPLADSRAVLDFPGQRIHLEPSNRHPARDFDAARAYLERERARYGDAPDRAIIRARLQLATDDLPGAIATLEAGIKARPDDPELHALLARIHRSRAEWPAMLDHLLPLPVDRLVGEGEWVGLINSLALLGRAPEALQRARAALDDPGVPAEDRAELYVALSDALVMRGDLPAAASAIDQATALRRGFSAHLLRKARIRGLEGDRYGSIVALRHLMQIFPLGGTPIWLYGLQLSPLDRGTFLADVQRTLSRLHPGDEPWDFAAAGFMAAGNPALARHALDEGRARDCAGLTAAALDNCTAWYLALGGDQLGSDRLDEADRLTRSALAAAPYNSAYVDTAATVYWARKEPEKAREYARLAALLSPDDPYLLWQHSRMEAR